MCEKRSGRARADGQVSFRSMGVVWVCVREGGHDGGGRQEKYEVFHIL